MWTEIIEYIKELFSGLLRQNTELKDRISAILNLISTLYLDLLEKIEKDIYPYSLGSLLIILNENLYNTLKNHIPVKNQVYFFKLIRNIKDPEKFYYQRNEINVKELITDFSWEIKNLSDYLKII